MTQQDFAIGQLVQTIWPVAALDPQHAFGAGELAFVAEVDPRRCRIAHGERLAWVDRGEIEAAQMCAPNKARMPLGIAQTLAEELAALLAPACERIEIAGSIRREKADVGDIEIVFVPRVGTATDLFGATVETRWSALDKLCGKLLGDGRLSYRLNEKGARAWGPQNKLAWFHSTSGGVMAADLFATTREQWGVYFVVRTGDADFSRLLVTERRAGGALPGGWKIKGWRLHTTGKRVSDTPEEMDFFGALGLPVIPPRERSAATLKRAVKDARIAENEARRASFRA